MKKIKIPAGSKQQTRINVPAVAWATNRRGHNSWKSDNVTEDIRKYLETHNVVIHPAQTIGATLRWFEDKGYGVRIIKGKRTVFFKFNDDVILTGMEPIFQPSEEEEVATLPESNPTEAKLVTINSNNPALTKLVVPPLPPTPEEVLKPPLYRFVEFMEAVDKWADKKPEDYVKWVNAVIPWLVEQ